MSSLRWAFSFCFVRFCPSLVVSFVPSCVPCTCSWMRYYGCIKLHDSPIRHLLLLALSVVRWGWVLYVQPCVRLCANVRRATLPGCDSKRRRTLSTNSTSSQDDTMHTVKTGT